jgi:ankyrin repeat protein
VHLTGAARWLAQAAVNSQAAMCGVLLQHGADRGVVNKEGRTPLDLAKTDAVRKALQAS